MEYVCLSVCPTNNRTSTSDNQFSIWSQSIYRQKSYVRARVREGFTTIQPNSDCRTSRSCHSCALHTNSNIIYWHAWTRNNRLDETSAVFRLAVLRCVERSNSILKFETEERLSERYMTFKRWMSTDVSQEAADPPSFAQQVQVQDDSLRALLCQPRCDMCTGNTYAIAEGPFED
jgi:hypothetical protein